MTKPMTNPTNTPSPEDRELIERWRSKADKLENGDEFFADEISSEFLLGALRLESLLSDRAKLEEALADNAELRSERDALLQKPIDLAKLDSIDEDASGKMVAYYWWQQAQDAREALKDERALVPPTNEGLTGNT